MVFSHFNRSSVWPHDISIGLACCHYIGMNHNTTHGSMDTVNCLDPKGFVDLQYNF